MARLDPKQWPELKAAWDAYGHEVPFDRLDGIKTDARACYVVVRWTEPDTGSVNLADLARARGGPWVMQNDGYDPITEADWRKLRVVSECDWFTIPGHEEFDRGTS